MLCQLVWDGGFDASLACLSTLFFVLEMSHVTYGCGHERRHAEEVLNKQSDTNGVYIYIGT